jgi:hypothetical protein
MDEVFTTKKLLVLRKLTRSISELLRQLLRSHLVTLEPLLRPRILYGEHVQGHGKDLVRGADKAFRELQAEFAAVSSAKPFNLRTELKSPFEVISAALEMNAVEYAYTAKGDRESKQVAVTSPLKWVLNYSGYSVPALRQLLADRHRTEEDVKRFVLHFLLVDGVIRKQQGIAALLESLRFNVTAEKWPDLGGLPILCITTDVSTYRPPDDVIIESTEISGTNAFEEFVDVEDIVRLREPFKEKLLEVVGAQAPELIRTA